MYMNSIVISVVRLVVVVLLDLRGYHTTTTNTLYIEFS